MASPSATIDSATKVNIGILSTMLTAAIGGAMFLASIKSEISAGNARLEAMAKTTNRMEEAIDKLISKVSEGERERGILKTLIDSWEARIRAIEKRD